MVSAFTDFVFLEVGTRDDSTVGAMMRDARRVQEGIWEEVMSWLSQPNNVVKEGLGHYHLPRPRGDGTRYVWVTIGSPD